MQWSGSTLDNVGAPIWVVDPMVEQVNDTESLRDTDLNRVRSVEGVAWAAPFYQGMVRARMQDGSFKYVQLIGVDATKFAGAPKDILQGRLDDLRLPNTVLVDEYGTKKLSRDPAKPLGLGEIFEINDKDGAAKERHAAIFPAVAAAVDHLGRRPVHLLARRLAGHPQNPNYLAR